ncbi:hypothetical protein SO802_034529 [Lithocarpus litseifolius]|uniref:Uncharacterized protein n=1 Tax=Lithocarpus litseifolius TaxID=425828 RepID=A0AAW2BJ46_9ROSI
MKAVLIRTGSVPALSPGSPRVTLYRNDSVSGVFTGEKSSVTSPKVSLHMDTNRRKDGGMRRAFSETDMIRSESGSSRVSGVGSRSFPSIIPEEEYVSDSELGSPGLNTNGAGVWPEIGIPVEEPGFSGGGGFGKGRKSGGGDNGIGNDEEKRKMAAYYIEMVKSNPGDSLLLRNYAKFLHEVEKDTVRAEEYYGRAILASPGDGELLSLYGKLIWETQRDGDRAKSYFDQAVYASPHDCMVLGSYAQFMWEAEEEEEEDENEESKDVSGSSRPPALVAGF